MFILAQIIGALAYLTISLSYFYKKKKTILFIQIIASVIFAVHYYLLDARTGTMCNILGIIALILIYIFDNYLSKKKKNLLIFILIPILVVISLLTYDDIYSIFPIIASVIALLSFLNDDTNEIRLIGLLSAICWFIYAIIVKSYPSIVFEVITIISVIIAYIKNKKK